MQKTKSVNEMFLSDSMLESLLREETIIETILESLYSPLIQELYVMKKDRIRFIKMENKEVYLFYDKNRDNAFIFPDLDKFEPGNQSWYNPFNSNTFKYLFSGYSGILPKRWEADMIFCQEDSPVKKKYEYMSCSDNNGNGYYVIDHADNCWSFNSSGGSGKISVHIPIQCRYPKNYSLLYILVVEKLIPEKLTKESKALLLNLQEDVSCSALFIDDCQENIIQLTAQGREWIKSGVFVDVKKTTLSRKQCVNILGEITLSKENVEPLILELLSCDYKRAGIAIYDRKKLYDPNRGHWELWSKKGKNGPKISFEELLTARNPIADIQHDGIIGIDFGTKSTVVMYQNGSSRIMSMRIGHGRFQEMPSKEDYENPTVMEFVDLQSFLKDYKEKEGKPDTSDQDIVISHEAYNHLKKEIDSSKYYAFFSDLKQWCAYKERQVRIQDHKKYMIELPAFLELKEKEVNPIELYAYYLGLFINNMYNGVYMNYLLSFPVTFEMAVRKKILESFTLGLKKSLPIDILEDENAMKEFRVLQGNSEPAAYAICALTQYKIEPEEEEPIFYGIFDFGGGTTDFDFGIWKYANEDEEMRYDYVIKHFGASGDRYLGGENLLAILAYDVCKENKELFAENEIPFFCPEECEPFEGSEVLLSSSEEAKMNIKILMEKLRPIWESGWIGDLIEEEGELCKEEKKEELESKKELEREKQIITKEMEQLLTGSILLNLFQQDGNVKECSLMVDPDELQLILYERIEKGVRNFFEALRMNFEKKLIKYSQDKPLEVKIFLAGNSSRSFLVPLLFEKYMQIIEEKFPSFKFCLYPPLGSDKEEQKLEISDIEEETDDNFIKLTGKTGVAYGLIAGGPTSRIKVISDIKDEIKFKYYIGRSKRGKFYPILKRETDYKKWVKFIDAKKTDFEFYFTELPEAEGGVISITGLKQKKRRIEKEYENAFVYIRSIAPTIIEYVAATEEGIKKDEFLENPILVELG